MERLNYKKTMETEILTQRFFLTSGCPNKCPYCYEKDEIKTYDIPQLTGKYIQILDMNFLANPNAINILRSLPKKKYELVCGIDYRLLTPEIAKLLKIKGFRKIRFAWDYGFKYQREMYKTYQKLRNGGFKYYDIWVFILVNWKIPFSDCIKKLDLLKVWNCRVSDCCYDGGYPKNEIDFNNNPRFNNKRFWSYQEIKKFRSLCRKHNHIVKFRIDPEEYK